MPSATKAQRRAGSDRQDFAGSFTCALAPAVLVVNGQGRVIQHSPGAPKLLESGGLRTVVPEPPPWPEPLLGLAAEAIRSRAVVEARTLQLPRSGAQPMWVRATALPVLDVPGQPLAVIEFQSLSALDPLLERAGRLERLASLGTLSAGVAHEIKNSLVAIKSFAELLLEKRQDVEMATLVREEVNRIDFLVGQVLRLANPTKQAFAPIHAHALLEASVRLIQPQLRARRLEQVVALDSRLDTVRGDARQLQQAFLNLLMNALEAMEEHGTLVVRSRLISVREPSASRTAARIRRQLEVSIQDNGPGIAPEHLERLFTAFFTTKPGGTGLGLTITRGIIHDHGGRIAIDSKPRQGTTVRIALPLAD